MIIVGFAVVVILVSAVHCGGIPTQPIEVHQIAFLHLLLRARYSNIVEQKLPSDNA